MNDYMTNLYAAAYDRQMLDAADQYCAPDEMLPLYTAQNKLDDLEAVYFEQFRGDLWTDFEPPIPF